MKDEKNPLKPTWPWLYTWPFSQYLAMQIFSQKTNSPRFEDRNPTTNKKTPAIVNIPLVPTDLISKLQFFVLDTNRRNYGHFQIVLKLELSRNVCLFTFLINGSLSRKERRNKCLLTATPDLKIEHGAKQYSIYIYIYILIYIEI
jgi:hypothetical protein